jgi:hypothetical protein
MDPAQGEQRCHGACNVGRQPTVTGAQAWETAGRPQTHCDVNHHLPPTRTPVFSLLERQEYLVSHIPALLFSADGLTETVLVMDEEARRLFRLGATPWEIRFSRILNLAVATINGTGALATPIVDDTSVLAYVDKEFEGPGSWTWTFRDVSGNLLFQKYQTTPKLDIITSDENMNELLAIVATLGISLGARLLARAAVSAAADILGQLAVKLSVVDAVSFSAAATSEEAIATAHLAFSARRARALVALMKAEGREAVVNLGGEFTPREVELHGPTQISVNPILPSRVAGLGKRYIPFLIKEPAENIGELFEPGSVQGYVARDLETGNLDVDRVASGMFETLAPGKQLKLAFHAPFGETPEAFTERFAKALADAGFKNVRKPFKVLVIEATR